ncbi:hypothetical protein ALC60_01228, partial [Trachymyrmex zeteki]
QIANVLLENDCIAGRENVSDRCPLPLVSYEESSSRIVPSTNLDITDVEHLCRFWISMRHANDGTWNLYASLQLDDTAILQAIITACENKCSNIVIFTDSKRVLEAISHTSVNHKNYLISYIKQNLWLAFQLETVVTLFWVPSHKGILGNEIADQLARNACNSNFLYTKFHTLIFNLKREEIVLVNRIRSNHYNLRYSFHRKNIVDSPDCACGDPR